MFRIRIGFFLIRIPPGRNLKSDPDTDPDHRKMLIFRNIDRKQLGLLPVLSVLHIFSNLCHSLLSVSIFVMICLKMSFGFWLSEQICPQRDPDLHTHTETDTGGKFLGDPELKHCCLECVLGSVTDPHSFIRVRIQKF